jgi:hypothetical protein
MLASMHRVMRVLAVGLVCGLVPACRRASEPAEHESPRAEALAAASTSKPATDGRAPAELACEDAIGEPARYPPAVSPDAPERAWLLRVRQRLLVHECGHGWSAQLKGCLANAHTDGDVARCLDDELAAAERDELTGELVALDQLVARMAAAQAHPAALDCTRVVAGHYGDARWRGKLSSYSVAQRQTLIAASRTRMLKACIDGAWSNTLRACIVAGGDNTCFEAFGMALSWGFPAAGVVDTTGIADCDAYGKTIERILACDALPAATRDALRAMYAKTKAAMAGATTADRAKLATSCKAGRDAIEQLAVTSGC